MPHEESPCFDTDRLSTRCGLFLLAEPSFIELVSLSSPHALSFGVRSPKRAKRSQERFLAFVKKGQDATQAMEERYAEVLSLPATPANMPWRIAALGRSAQSYWQFAQLLVSMEIPSDVREGPYARDASDAFCDALEQHSQPLIEFARELAQACQSLARDTSPVWLSRCQEIETGSQ